MSQDTLLDLKDQITQWTFGETTETGKSMRVREILEEEHDKRLNAIGDLSLKSRFDLPLEFFQNAIYEWQNQLPKLSSSLTSDDHQELCCFMRKKRKTILDESLLTSNETARQSCFARLKPEILINAIKERPKFRYIGNLSFDILLFKIMKKLKILFETTSCPALQETPHGLFNWTMEEFYERRQINSTLWLDVLQKNAMQCLEQQKLRVDLEELTKFVELIFYGVTNDEALFNFEDDVMRPLHEAFEYLSMQKILTQELIANREIYYALSQKTSLIESRMQKKRLSEYAPIHIREELLDMEIFYPIVKRYITSYYQSEAEDCELKINAEIKHLKNEIEAIQAEDKEISGVMHATLGMYYTQIDKYKELINEYREAHGKYEELDNQLNYRKLTIVKLENQHKYLIDQMQRFCNEIEEIHQKEIVEREEEARQAKLKGDEAASRAKAKAKKAKNELKTKKK